MTGDLTNLRALRAANLEQKHAELDEKYAKEDVFEINGKLSKNDLTGARLKQMMVSAGNPMVAVKLFRPRKVVGLAVI